MDVEEGVYGLIESPNIRTVRFGDYDIDTWYGSAVYFARDRKTLGFRYSSLDNPSRSKTLVNKEEIWLEKLYICDHCFKYTEIKEEFDLHIEVCSLRDTQLGKIMYRDDQVTIRKVKGSKHRLFCQNLCLFTKLFLDNKSVFFTVDFFEYYVVFDRSNDKPMGFFSKELLSTDRNNLACILVFPPYQRKHLGTLLIAFSYELSKAEDLISGPEKPLSPFGLVGYLRYWGTSLAREFLHGEFNGLDEITLEEISEITGIRQDDVVTTLKHMKVLIKKDSTVYIQRKVIKQWLIDFKINLNPPIDKENLIIE